MSIRIEQPNSLEFIQMLETRQHDLFTGLFDLASEKNFVEDSVDLHHEKQLIW